MATIQEVRNKFRGISRKVKSRIPRMIEDSSFDMIELNHSQLSYGLDSKGNKLTPEYKNPKYAQKKFSINGNAGFGIPDLKFTGKWYRGFEVKVSYGRFELDSSNSKTEDLVSKYGKYIFGLTTQSKIIYANETLSIEIRGYIRLLTGI